MLQNHFHKTKKELNAYSNQMKYSFLIHSEGKEMIQIEDKHSK